MTPYEIPFEPQAQTFVISLGAISYRLTTSWCGPAGVWTLDVAKPDGTPIVSGIPIVTGVDLFAQYGYLGFGGKVFVQSAGDVRASPDYSELGVDSQVFYIVED